LCSKYLKVSYRIVRTKFYFAINRQLSGRNFCVFFLIALKHNNRWDTVTIGSTSYKNFYLVINTSIRNNIYVWYHRWLIHNHYFWCRKYFIWNYFN